MFPQALPHPSSWMDMGTPEPHVPQCKKELVLMDHQPYRWFELSGFHFQGLDGFSGNLHIDTNPGTPLPSSPSPLACIFPIPMETSPTHHVGTKPLSSLAHATLSRAHPQEGNRMRDAPWHILVPGVGLTTTSAPPHPAALQQGQGGHLHETCETQEEAGG